MELAVNITYNGDRWVYLDNVWFLGEDFFDFCANNFDWNFGQDFTFGGLFDMMIDIKTIWHIILIYLKNKYA